MAEPLEVYEAIARSLREFGYSDVTAEIVRETDEHFGEHPHGIVSMFAEKQLTEARENGLLEARNG